MKRLFSLLVLALSFSAIFAQQTTVALLNHEGTITTYYGSEALVQAHKAAVHGDVITLSGGGFTAPSAWTKAVTLRGAGCFAGEDNSREVTSIGNVFSVKISSDVEETMIIEGISFLSNFSISYVDNTSNRIKNTTFIKCHFMGSVSGICYNTNFYNCVITSNLSFYAGSEYLADVNLFNCYINHPENSSSFVSTKFNNCIVRFPHSNNGYDDDYPDEMGYAKYNNCIFLGNTKSDKSTNPTTANNIPTTCTATNCLSCFCAYKAATDTEDAIYDYNIFDNLVNTTNKYLENGKPIANTIKSIFKTYNGTANFTFHELYELTDEAKAAYIGSDGTQIGIYGGMGFDLVPSTLQITKCEVSPKATKEGKISVSIEVGIPE